MIKIIILLLMAVTITSSAQMIRTYKKCEFYGHRNEETIEYEKATIKVVWNDDNDCPANLKSISYPNIRIVLDESPELDGVIDGSPYYYFNGVTDDNQNLSGTIIDSSDGYCSISLLFGKGHYQYVIFRKSIFKYTSTAKELK